jgi:hypothetical protein
MDCAWRGAAILASLRPMKSTVIAMATVIFGSISALAGSDPPPAPAPAAAPLPPPPAGGVVVSADGRVMISPSLCADLASAFAVPGADYKPGVDVAGQPVVPADLPSTAPLPLGPIEVGIDLKQRFGIGANSHLMQHRPAVGLVTVLAGVAYLNGFPLADNERGAMLAACEAARH